MTARRSFFRSVSAALFVAFSATAPAGANLLVNGSFESGPDITSGFLRLLSGSTEITGWVVTRADIDYTSSQFWQVSDGDRNLDLDGGAAGGVEQTFATVPGTSYDVTWDFAGNPGFGPTIKTMVVAAASQQATFTFDITGRSFTDMGYVSKAWSFTADAASTTLEFYSQTSPAGFGPVIDNVVVVPTVVTSTKPTGWGRIKDLYR
jgi:choice-of-anchor C domain-containing protein